MEFPSSESAVRVRMIDTTCRLTIHTESFIEPAPAGLEVYEVPNAAFLVEHEASGQKLVFDLGIRKDYWNLPAVILRRLGSGVAIPNLSIEKGTHEILEEHGVPLHTIDAVVWSHFHWDHIGDVSVFPPSTSLVVGPGFKAAPNLLPGYPEKLDSPVPSDAFAGRQLQEIDFSQSSLVIGGFRAYDFFSDGSFYLLDTPGHAVGHICGLARTTVGENSTFVFMGGDICHFAGCFRPSPAIPLPDPIPADILDKKMFFPCPCPATLFTDQHPRNHAEGSPRTTPFYRISTKSNSAYINPEIAQESVEKLMLFDSSPSVLVCFAHDSALPRFLPALNEQADLDLNAWKADGLNRSCHWDWLNYLPRNGQPGRKPQIEGLRRDGKPWPEAREYLQRHSSHVIGTGL